jgi:flagellar protein FliO/FliZ
MDTVDPLRFVFAFVFILALIGVMALLLKRFGKWQAMAISHDANSRIHIVETRYLDPKRRLVLIRRDDTEHLLLLADGRELVIESGSKAAMMSPSSSVDS